MLNNPLMGNVVFGPQSVTASIPKLTTTCIDPFRAKLKKFLPVARAFAAMSKDPSTKVGALILGLDFEVRASGWNGAPRHCKADEDSRFERPEKYYWSSHAEMNAIAQAAKAGTSIQSCSMVVTHAPCMTCAKLIVQAGIARVVCPIPNADFLLRWKEDLSRTERLFRECHVILDWVEE